MDPLKIAEDLTTPGAVLQFFADLIPLLHLDASGREQLRAVVNTALDAPQANHSSSGITDAMMNTEPTAESRFTARLVAGFTVE